MTSIYEGYESVAQREHPDAFELCICGRPRWKHPSNEDDRKAIAWTTVSGEVPHHLFIAPRFESSEPTEHDGPIAISDPAIVDMAEALRCTTHIENRGLRAGYLVTDMRIRGWVFLRRDDKGRFAKGTDR